MLKPCAHCGGKAHVLTDYDANGITWKFVGCWDCGLRTRGKWLSSPSDDCPMFYEDVRAEWNARPVSGGE